MNQAIKEPTLTDIIHINTQYKVIPEIQFVRASVELDARNICLQYPYQPEDYIWAIFHIENPTANNDEVDKHAQEYLKNNPNVQDYIRGYLQQAMRNIH